MYVNGERFVGFVGTACDVLCQVSEIQCYGLVVSSLFAIVMVFCTLSKSEMNFKSSGSIHVSTFNIDWCTSIVSVKSTKFPEKQTGSLWLILFRKRLILSSSSFTSFRPCPGGSVLKICIGFPRRSR